MTYEDPDYMPRHPDKPMGFEEACQRCGALVVDTGIHNRWHRRLGALVHAAGGALLVNGERWSP